MFEYTIDMIGGNAYVIEDNGNIDFDKDKFPEAELFVRWAQVSAFMPAMQFSIRPWLYNESSLNLNVNEICKNAVDIHENVVYPLLEKYANRSVETGEPIIRPVWWIDNSDEDSYLIDDEFLVGDEILVAPVVTQNATMREIFIPKGNWNYTNGSIFIGPMKAVFPAPLEHVPYFIRVN
jgi:myogenesis-regulating glycosidase